MVYENHIVQGIEDETPAPLFGVWEWEYNNEVEWEEYAKSSAEYFRERARERWGA